MTVLYHSVSVKVRNRQKQICNGNNQRVVVWEVGEGRLAGEGQEGTFWVDGDILSQWEYGSKVYVFVKNVLSGMLKICTFYCLNVLPQKKNKGLETNMDSVLIVYMLKC